MMTMGMASAAGTDFAAFSALKHGAANKDPAALREVASQFEALFMQTLLKNMRAGQLAEPLFDSDQHEMYLDMMDRELALEMARGRGLGFAEMLVRQLGGTPLPAPEAPQGRIAFSPPPPASRPAPEPDWSAPEHFVRDLWPHVKRIGARLNVSPEAVLAQAALETGWGRHVLRRADGSSSNNLFGIKAGSDWYGGSVVRKSIEFVGGMAEQVRSRFRAYPDVAAAFDDFAALIEKGGRYRAVRGADAAGYAQALQDSGYATDPMYAAKIRRVLDSDTMRDAIEPLKTGRALPITIEDTPTAAR